MARPNNAAAIANYVRGLREAKAAFQKLPEIARDTLLGATTETVEAIARGAEFRLKTSPSIQTRALLNHVKWSVNKKNGRGRVGIATGSTTVNVRPGVRKNVRVKGILIPGKGGSALKSQGARLVKPSRYAHLVEFGSRHMDAEPFMLPSADAQQQPFLARCRAAGPHIEAAMKRTGTGASTEPTS